MKIFEIARMPYQNDEPADESMIAAWENSHGLRLPEDYRLFILATNGGALRPYTFKVLHSAISEQWHALVCLYSWRDAIDHSQEDIAAHLRNPPPDHLAIGDTSSELILMLSLSEANFGSVVIWPKNLFDAWGDGMNTVLIPLTESFTDFLELLQTPDIQPVYQGYWADEKETSAAKLIMHPPMCSGDTVRFSK